MDINMVPHDTSNDMDWERRVEIVFAISSALMILHAVPILYGHHVLGLTLTQYQGTVHEWLIHLAVVLGMSSIAGFFITCALGCKYLSDNDAKP